MTAVRDCHCQILEARSTLLGSKNALLLMLSGPWDSIAKVESSLDRIAKQYAVKLNVERTEQATTGGHFLPYAIEIVAQQDEQSIFSIVSFFTERGAVIADLNAHSYKSQRSETAMIQVQLAVDVPADTSIANLRGEFMDFCDQLNLDAILEPAK